MGIWTKLMRATQAAITAWREEAFVPIDADWDDYQYRIIRYHLATHFYSNTAYRAINAASARMKADHKLYKHIRSIYNPVERLTEGTVAAVYGGYLDMLELRTGAIPVATDDDTLRDSIVELYKWSNMRSVKSLYVRNMTMYGDAFIKVVDDVESGRVRLEIVEPYKIAQIESDSVGNIKRILIEYQRQDGENETPYIYREEIDQERFITYKNGERFAYVNDATGNPVAEWSNPYGFVPVVHVKYRDLGYTYGGNAFNAQIPKINEINDQASMLGDSVRVAINPLFLAQGIPKGALTTNSDEETRDSIRIIYSSLTDSSFSPLNIPVDITAAAGHLDMLLKELENDLPVLALHKIRSTSNLTKPGVEAAYSDAIKRIEEVQGNADDGLIRATQMALTIAGLRGLNPYNLNSYDMGDLDFYIKPREIISDGLTKAEKVQVLATLDSNNPMAALILQELGYSAGAVQDAEQRIERTQSRRMLEETVRAQQSRANQLVMLGQQTRAAAQQRVNSDEQPES